MAKYANLKGRLNLSSRELEDCYLLINKYKNLLIAVGNL